MATQFPQPSAVAPDAKPPTVTDLKPAALQPPSQPAPLQEPSPPLTNPDFADDPKVSTSSDLRNNATPPFSPTSQTPVLPKEQEDFEGTVNVTNDIPTEKELQRVEDMLLLDADGVSRPFKELYQAPMVAPRQLIIFIRHFFCGNCQEYLRTLSSSISPEDLLALPTPTFITVIGCGRPELIPMYVETTSCPFPVYADPTRKLYDLLGMTRTFEMGKKPEYMQSNTIINSMQSIVQGIGTGKNALKGGDMKQVGGEFMFEDEQCIWAHRMKTTRDHTEVMELRSMLGLDNTKPPLRKRWSHAIKEKKDQKDQEKQQQKEANREKRSSIMGRLRSKSKGTKDAPAPLNEEKVADNDFKRVSGEATV